MSLFPVAPGLALRVSEARVGMPLDTQIVVSVREAVTLDFIDAQLDVLEGWAVGSGKHRVARRVHVHALRGRVFSGGTLPVGEHQFPLRFPLPDGLAPAIRTPHAYVTYRLALHASIPWWPDARSTFEIPVRAPRANVEPQPAVFSNGGDGGTTPRLEVSLASSRVATSGVVRGAVAAVHHDASVLRGLRLSLRSHVRMWSGGGAERTRLTPAYVLPLPAQLPPDGTPVPFELALPPDVAPSWRTATLALDWLLAVERPGMFSNDTLIAVPFTVHESPALSAQAQRLVVPPVGDARIAGVLAEIARQQGLSSDGHTLEGTIGEASFRISREARADEGTVLVAQLDLPRAGLGLVVSRARFLPQLLQRDVAIGHDAFDELHHVIAREPQQARAYLATVAPLLSTGALRSLDDELAILERPTKEVTLQSVGALVHEVRAITGALLEARASIPPPSGVVSQLDAWADVTRVLAARFVVGDLSLVGRLGQSEVRIETRILPEGSAHEIRVRAHPPIPPEVQLASHDPRADARALASAYGGPLAELVASLPEGARDLSVSGGEASVRLQLALRDGVPVDDPRGALRAAQVLARMGHLFGPARGPFR